MYTVTKESRQFATTERPRLVETLCNSVAARTSNSPITEAQKLELDRRLAKRATEKPSGVSLDQIAQKLGVVI